MVDPTEAREKGIKKPKHSTKHPYAAIEHRVLDSAAYADLTFAARAVLVLLTRQLTKDNNGHLQATYKWMSRYGIGSEHTLSKAIKQLVSHGFIYRTRCGGYQNGASLYAVTWLPITRKQGIFLDGFLSCAWRYWEPEKNLPPRKMQEPSCKKGICTPAVTAQNAGGSPLKNADYELMPCRGADIALPRCEVQP